MEPTLRSTQVLKEEAEDIGLQGKDIAEYVTRQQTLEERRGQLGEIPRKDKQKIRRCRLRQKSSWQGFEQKQRKRGGKNYKQKIKRERKNCRQKRKREG